jgi:hypothetical protein
MARGLISQKESQKKNKERNRKRQYRNGLEAVLEAISDRLVRMGENKEEALPGQDPRCLYTPGVMDQGFLKDPMTRITLITGQWSAMSG